MKHYAANNQETDRFVVNEIIDERTLHEIYLPAFEASIKQGHSASVMCSYPRVNGTYACENDVLLAQVLRKEWGFQGFVMSDFGATHSAAPAAMAGLDLEMPSGIYFGDPLKKAVQSGQVPESVIDEMLVRRFRALMQFGLFDHPPVPRPIPAQQDGVAARRLAEAGMVLLKNSGGAPPARCRAPEIHCGAWVLTPRKPRPAGAGVRTSWRYIPWRPWTASRIVPAPAVSVSFADGSDVSQAAALARSADVAIVMVGDKATEGKDHPIVLGENQDALVEAVAAANPRTIVVLKTGSPMLMPWLDAVPSILEAWYPGEEDGHAVAAILFGDVNPSGKLPITFPKSIADEPANTPEQYPGVNQTAHYSEGVFVGYRHYDAQRNRAALPIRVRPLLHDLRVQESQDLSREHLRCRRGIARDCPVRRHQYRRRGRGEVAELYVGLPSTDAVPEPPKQLKGFQKVELKAGETRHVQIALDARSFSYWDVGNACMDRDAWHGEGDGGRLVARYSAARRSRSPRRSSIESNRPGRLAGGLAQRQTDEAQAVFLLSTSVRQGN